MLVRPLLSESMSFPIGLPSTMIMRRPTMTVVSRGITSTGIRPRAHAGTVQLAIQWATRPASTPPTMAPRKPVAGRLVGLVAAPSLTAKMLVARPPAMKPGAMPGRSAIA